MGDAYALSHTDVDLNLAPPIIMRNFILGTLVSATPCNQKVKTHGPPTKLDLDFHRSILK